MPQQGSCLSARQVLPPRVRRCSSGLRKCSLHTVGLHKCYPLITVFPFSAPFSMPEGRGQSGGRGVGKGGVQ